MVNLPPIHNNGKDNAVGSSSPGSNNRQSVSPTRVSVARGTVVPSSPTVASASRLVTDNTAISVDQTQDDQPSESRDVCEYASKEELLDAAMYSFGITIDELRNAFIPNDAPDVLDDDRQEFQMKLAESQRRRFIKMVHQEAKALGENRSRFERVTKLMEQGVGRRGSLGLDIEMVEAAVRFNEQTIDKSKCKAPPAKNFDTERDAAAMANKNSQDRTESELAIFNKNLEIERNRLERFKQQEQKMLERNLKEDIMFMERQNTYRSRMDEKEGRSRSIAIAAKKAAKERAIEIASKEQEAKERYSRVQEEHIEKRDRMRKMLQSKADRTNAILRNKEKMLEDKLKNQSNHWESLNDRREQHDYDIETKCIELQEKRLQKEEQAEKNLEKKRIKQKGRHVEMQKKFQEKRNEVLAEIEERKKQQEKEIEEKLARAHEAEELQDEKMKERRNMVRERRFLRFGRVAERIEKVLKDKKDKDKKIIDKFTVKAEAMEKNREKMMEQKAIATHEKREIMNSVVQRNRQKLIRHEELTRLDMIAAERERRSQMSMLNSVKEKIKHLKEGTKRQQIKTRQQIRNLMSKIKGARSRQELHLMLTPVCPDLAIQYADDTTNPQAANRDY